MPAGGPVGSAGLRGDADRACRGGQPLDHLPARRGEYFPFRSAATGRTYHIYVRLPGGGRWLSVGEARVDRPWRLFGERIEGGTHAANAPDAYRIGMRRLFAADGSP